MSSTSVTRRPGAKRSPVEPRLAPGRLPRLRPAARLLRGAYRQATSGLRVLPDFLIIGAQKSGTTSLYDYVAMHPLVRPAATKEVHFFDRHHDRGTGWYRAHFPIRQAMHPGFRPGTITGEATPAYLLFPRAAERAHRVVPEARLIAVLRNPVDRAFSHYHHEVAKGFEHLSFEDAIEREGERLVAAGGSIPREGAMSHALEHHSYLRRGHYAEQLQRWLDHYPSEQLLVLAAEDLYGDPGPTMGRVFRHLAVDPARTGPWVARNARSYPPMDPAVRARLTAYFAPHNERLEDLVRAHFRW